MQQQTQLRAGTPNAPQKARPPPQSRTRPLLQSRSLNLTTPSANWRTSAMKTQHRRSARGKGGNITPRSAGRTKSTLSPCQSTSLYPTQTRRKSVKLLPTSTCSLWLCIEDIPWLVRWISDELRSGGVPLPKSDPLDALDCNCEAEHVHSRWDFGGSWEAIILAGDKRCSTTTCSVEKFNEEKRLAVGAS